MSCRSTCEGTKGCDRNGTQIVIVPRQNAIRIDSMALHWPDVGLPDIHVCPLDFRRVLSDGRHSPNAETLLRSNFLHVPHSLVADCLDSDAATKNLNSAVIKSSTQLF